MGLRILKKSKFLVSTEKAHQDDCPARSEQGQVGWSDKVALIRIYQVPVAVWFCV
jgi:hypothetical protein